MPDTALPVDLPPGLVLTSPEPTVTFTVPACLVPVIRRLADDERVWCNRLADQRATQHGADAMRIYREASDRATDAGRIVRACDQVLGR